MEHSLFPFAGLFQSFTFFLLNFLKTFTCHSSCFRICHSKYIISLNSSIHSTVPWDWLTKWFNFLRIWNLVDCEELFNCLRVLLGGHLLFLIFQKQFVISLCLFVWLLFFFDFGWSVGAVKCMVLRWWDWLLIEIFSSLDSYYLGGSFYLSSLESVIYKLFLHYRVIFYVCWLVNSSCKWLSFWCKTCFSVCFSKYVFWFYSWDISSISRNLLSRFLALLEIRSWSCL